MVLRSDRFVLEPMGRDGNKVNDGSVRHDKLAGDKFQTLQVGADAVYVSRLEMTDENLPPLFVTHSAEKLLEIILAQPFNEAAYLFLVTGVHNMRTLLSLDERYKYIISQIDENVNEIVFL